MGSKKLHGNGKAWKCNENRNTNVDDSYQLTVERCLVRLQTETESSTLDNVRFSILRWKGFFSENFLWSLQNLFSNDEYLNLLAYSTVSWVSELKFNLWRIFNSLWLVENLQCNSSVPLNENIYLWFLTNSSLFW